ncbi:hypothetical protein NX059_005824 [Plenodomus lindquistii]|nr:hypothetical protein NX059_005824 [Plenodomus lindquistii]
MQLSPLLTGLLSALMMSNAVIAAGYDSRVVSECTAENDCCFSTKGACERQSAIYIEQYVVCPRLKYCPDLGVPLTSCNADCCSIRTKGGRGCPGK